MWIWNFSSKLFFETHILPQKCSTLIKQVKKEIYTFHLQWKLCVEKSVIQIQNNNLWVHISSSDNDYFRSAAILCWRYEKKLEIDIKRNVELVSGKFAPHKLKKQINRRLCGICVEWFRRNNSRSVLFA